jgi:aspartyl-tRNA(Asn)/glutamyl-tRNA(Gln) amidotransferase subunit A
MTKFDSLVSYYEKVRSEGFGNEVKRRILLWTFVLSSANYEGFYLKAQKARDQLKQDFDEVFKTYDLILTPTAPDVAWKLGAKSNDPLAMYLEDLYTIPANMWWLPAMSVPAGKIEDQWEMMPVGIQLIWNKWQENKILALGKLIESL